LFLFNEDFIKVVDLEVIKQRSGVPSETTETRENFCADLLVRDLCCVWTGNAPARGAGMHIIPYRPDSEVCSTFFLRWYDI
jgi:hypothetical protein